MTDSNPPADVFSDAAAFGRSLGPGIGLNLLVSDTARHRDFAVAVLGATVLHHSADFSVFSLGGTLWMIHADHTYKTNALYGVATRSEGRGAGARRWLDGAGRRRRQAARTARGGHSG